MMKLLIEVEVELTNERREMIKSLDPVQISTQLQIIENKVRERLFESDSMKSMIVRSRMKKQMKVFKNRGEKNE